MAATLILIVAGIGLVIGTGCMIAVLIEEMAVFKEKE
jgi:hypothetical protein